MTLSLLSTKFYIPPQRPDSVGRSRLTEKLRAALDRPHCFTLLSGPAGSGKTTLLSQFVASLDRPVAWLSLDQADDDPTRFWTYLIAALQRARPGTGDAALALLEAGQRLPGETIPTLLINDLAQATGALVLVLDDCHLIRDPTIHESVLFLLDYLPPALHVVISTRVDPPWPLARFRARHQLVEIRAQDLRFSLAEAAAFFNQSMRLDLSEEDVATLAARTEGWAAGLQLAAVALQASPGAAPERDGGASAFVQAFAGSHVYVAEYLVEEVLRRQPPALQTFLLQTAILQRLSADLCDAVTGQHGSQATLAALHRANLFLIPLDGEARWFRYHHLFADLLQARLRQEQPAGAVAALHIRAATWYEQQGLEAEAVHHALAAQDLERVAILVDRAGQRLIFTDQYRQLQSWLESLPPAALQSHPRLEIYRVLLELTRGTLDMSVQTLRDKERLINSLPPTPENERLQVEAKMYLALFLAFQNTTRAIQFAQEALAVIPEDDLKRRAYLFAALYRAYGMDGDYEKGREAYVESMRLAHAAGHYGMAANTTMIRAFDLCQYGKLDEAARYCQEIVDAGADRPPKIFFSAGPAYIGLGGICLERYQLEEAADYLEEGIQLAHQGGLYGLFTGFTQKARLYQAQGQLDRAVAELETLEQTLQRREFTLMARHVSLRLARGDSAAAARLEATLLALLAGSPYARRLPLIAVEALKLSLARLALARDDLARAGQLLDEVQATVEPGGRLGRLLEVHLLRALLLQKQQGRALSTAALAHLERALELGEPAGMLLLFLEEGRPLVSLLQAVAGRQPAVSPAGQHACRLLAALGEEALPPTPLPVAVPGLLETLSSRELEVLQLIAAGDSNQAIAGKLFITVRTVKKHAGNVYAKLQVTSRTQAVARARELGLFPGDS